MSKDQALRLALEALLEYQDHLRGQAITAIKQALAQPEPEPVAWQWLNTAHFRKKLPKNAEKGAWNPLYTSPPKREPLTDEEIKRMAAPLFMSHYWGMCNEFARAIEAAHGIKGEA